MKKVIGKIIFILVIVGVVFGGKKYIDNRTYNYDAEINEALTNYFVKNDPSGLNTILDALDKNKNNEAKRTEIQNYSYTIVGAWFTYIDGKYVCADDNFRINKNSCTNQLAEYKDLYNKLVQLYNYKSKSGYTILLPSYYNSLASQSQKIINDLEKKASVGRNPQDSEEVRENKCNKATDCENCRDGICKCYYTADGAREELVCNKDIENS